MTNIWRKRALRFWLVILLPIALYSGYEAYESHKSISFWQDLVVKWHESLKEKDRGEYLGAFDPQEQFEEAVRGREASIDSRFFYSIVGGVLLCFPIIVWLIWGVCAWILFGRNRKSL